MLLHSDFNHIAATYHPLGRKIGTETEYLVAQHDSSPIAVETADILQQSYESGGLNFSREIFAGIFESKTHAYDPHRMGDLCNENDAIRTHMTKITHYHGLMLSGDSFDPDLTLQQALDYRIPHPRADGLLRRLQQDGHATIAKHCVMTTSIHVSLGFESADDALRIANLASRMTPILTLLTENNCGRFEGRAQNGHVMAALRHAQGPRTEIQRYFYNAVNGQDFIERHIRHISSVPAMMYLDSYDEPQVFPTFDNKGLQDLAAAGLANRDNYFLIEKMQYNDVKLAAILDDDKQVTGHRIELRMADRGTHQHDSMVVIASMMMNDKVAAQLDAMLKRFGYDREDPHCYHRVCADLNVAINHGGRHLHQKMHSGASFGDMARELGDIVKNAVAHSPDIAKRAEGLLSICRTGVNQAHSRKNKQIRGCVPA